MIFVDTNVFIYAVGRAHPLRPVARRFFEQAGSRDRLCTSAEVLQELLHAYVQVGRIATLDAARALVAGRVETVWPIEWPDVEFARQLLDRFPGLGARDLLHLACCKRRGASNIQTFDRALAAAFSQG